MILLVKPFLKLFLVFLIYHMKTSRFLLFLGFFAPISRSSHTFFASRTVILQKNTSLFLVKPQKEIRVFSKEYPHASQRVRGSIFLMIICFRQRVPSARAVPA